MAKECKEYPGFYHIPNNERFVINRESRVIDTDIHCCMVQYLNAGYPYCPSVGFTHRAVAMGFTKSPNIGGARRKPTPVKITDPDGNVKEWLSVEEFGKGFGVPKNTIQASINRKGHWKGYQVTYL